jgi:hypothetical protein
MAHVRRKFYDLQVAHKSLIAHDEALERIAALYAIEKEIRSRPPNERRAIRQTRARPLLESFREWLESGLTKLSQKSDTTAAVKYALGRWEALTRYAEDGGLEIDNNAAYAARGISGRMPTFGLCRHVDHGSRSTDVQSTCNRHNQRPSRKARRRSGGRYRSGTAPDGLEWASARSLSCISACK